MWTLKKEKNNYLIFSRKSRKKNKKNIKTHRVTNINIPRFLKRSHGSLNTFSSVQAKVRFKSEKRLEVFLGVQESAQMRSRAQPQSLIRGLIGLPLPSSDIGTSLGPP